MCWALPIDTDKFQIRNLGNFQMHIIKAYLFLKHVTWLFCLLVNNWNFLLLVYLHTGK